MSEEMQNIPTLNMWKRILRIRQEMSNEEGSGSLQAYEEALASHTLSLDSIQAELMNEVPDIPFKHWNPFEKFTQWDKAR